MTGFEKAPLMIHPFSYSKKLTQRSQAEEERSNITFIAGKLLENSD